VASLDGIRIVDLTRLLPGAYATLLLADLGAEVVKLEDPRGGDGMRRLPADGDARLKPARYSVYFELLNRNKKSVTLDLRAPESAAVIDALAEWADVFVDSFRPSTARRLGVDGESLRARHPRLICASITGFGLTGPYVERAAHDINYQALAGLLVRNPRMPGPLIADISSAMQTALGIVAALLQRSRTGNGANVDISIHEAALAWSMFPTTGDLAGPCYMLYETADGEWLALGALEPKFWRAFCDRIGRADLIPLQFARGDVRDRVLDDVRTLIKARTRAEWLASFKDVDACLTTVHTRDETEADPHVRSRRVAARDGDLVYVTPPGVPVVPAPALGANTDGVLDAAGIDAARRHALRRATVI
jgi:alpha-methylacyl-CoA racemase